MALGQITVDLLLKTGSFATSTKQAEKSLQGLKTSAIGMGKAIHTAIAAAAASAPIVALRETINAMDEMSKSAQKVGITTEEFSKLNYAASLADVSMETLVGSLGRLTKAQGDALKSTSEQAKVFDALGIAVKGSDGSLRDSTDVLADFADRFQQLQGSPEAMAAGFAIFGRSFQTMIPLLKDGGAGIREAGAELESFGGVLSTNAGKQAEAFNDNLTRLKTMAKSLATTIVSDLLPDLVKLSEQFSGTAKRGGELADIANDIENVIRIVGDAVKFVYGYFDAFGDVLGGATYGLIGFNEAAKGVINLDWDQIKRGLKLAQEGADLAYYGEEKAAKRNPGAYDTTQPRNRAGPSRRGGGPMNMAPSTGGATQEEIDAYTRKLQAALENNAEKSNGAIRKSAKEAKDAATEAMEAYNDIYGQAQGNADSQVASLEQEIALWGDRTEAAKTSYEIQHGSLQGISQAQADYLISLAKTRDALEDYDAIYGEVKDKAKESTDAMAGYADEAARNMQDSFADFLFDPFKDGADGMLKNFSETIRRIAAEAAAARILQQIGSWASGYTGTGSGWINMIGGALTKKAAGGYISGPGTATSDSIPARLSNGEYVIQADAVSKYGKGFFDSLNTRRFASGGYVGVPNIRAPMVNSSAKRVVQQVFNTQIQGRMDRTTEEQFHRRQGRASARAISRTGQ